MDLNKIFYRILISGIIIAEILLLISTIVLFNENSRLKNDLAEKNKIANPLCLTEVSAVAMYNGGPIDWEGCSSVDYFACESDADCLKVDTDDCIECYDDVSINKKYLARWNVRVRSSMRVCMDGGMLPLQGESDSEFEARQPIPCRKGVVSKCVEKECRLVLE
ncbi:MAG: hypothetical protein WC528_05020 [Patescibacteria group bacterium]